MDPIPLFKLGRPLGNRVHEKLVEEGEKEQAKHAGWTDPSRCTVRLNMGGSLGSKKVADAPYKHSKLLLQEV